MSLSLYICIPIYIYTHASMCISVSLSIYIYKYMYIKIARQMAIDILQHRTAISCSMQQYTATWQQHTALYRNV